MDTTIERCWADYRGDCARGISREHLVSKALFPDQVIHVSGFNWCQGEERRVGVNSLQRRFLCTKHNNDLSPADEAGVQAIDAFATGFSQVALRGPLLERWLVKTAINLSVGGELHIGHGMTDSKPGRPSPYLLAVAFGDLSLSEKMGAYFVFPKGSYMHRVGEIAVVPVHKNGAIGGFLFALRGQFVFLNLFPGYAPPCIDKWFPALLPETSSAATLVYRPNEISVQVGCGSHNTFQIQWP